MQNSKNILALLLRFRSAERMTATGEPVVTFEEGAAGSPDAIRAIFYPGETFGFRFMYPEDRTDGEAGLVHHTQQ